MSSSPSSSKHGKPSFNLQKALDKCVSDWDKAKANRDKAETDLALVSPTRPKDTKPILKKKFINTITTNDMLSSSSSSKDGKSLFNLQKALDKTVSDWDKAKAERDKFTSSSKYGKSSFKIQKVLDKTVSDWDKAKATKDKTPTALVTPTRRKDAKPMYPKPPRRQN